MYVYIYCIGQKVHLGFPIKYYRLCVYINIYIYININIYIYLYIYIMEYYSAIKKNEILPFVTTWMDLEGIVLSEINQRKTNTV